MKFLSLVKCRVVFFYGMHEKGRGCVELTGGMFMSYRVEYNAMEVKQEKQRDFKARQWLLGIVCLLGIVTGIYACGMGDRLKEILLPGNADVTESAFSNMVERITQGENAVMAFTSFCQEIIDHADTE